MNHVKSGTIFDIPAPAFQHQVKHRVRTQRSLGEIDLKGRKTQLFQWVFHQRTEPLVN